MLLNINFRLSILLLGKWYSGARWGRLLVSVGVHFPSICDRELLWLQFGWISFTVNSLFHFWMNEVVNGPWLAAFGLVMHWVILCISVYCINSFVILFFSNTVGTCKCRYDHSGRWSQSSWYRYTVMKFKPEVIISTRQTFIIFVKYIKYKNLSITC